MPSDEPLYTPEQMQAATLVIAFVIGMVLGALIAGLGIWVAAAQ